VHCHSGCIRQRRGVHSRQCTCAGVITVHEYIHSPASARSVTRLTLTVVVEMRQRRTRWLTASTQSHTTTYRTIVLCAPRTMHTLLVTAMTRSCRHVDVQSVIVYCHVRVCALTRPLLDTSTHSACRTGTVSTARNRRRRHPNTRRPACTGLNM
jgi:hypothetical protein